MDKQQILVLESYDIENNAKWGVSLNGHNPETFEFIPCDNKQQAFNLKEELCRDEAVIFWDKIGTAGSLGTVKIAEFYMCDEDGPRIIEVNDAGGELGLEAVGHLGIEMPIGL